RVVGTAHQIIGAENIVAVAGQFIASAEHQVVLGLLVQGIVGTADKVVLGAIHHFVGQAIDQVDGSVTQGVFGVVHHNHGGIVGDGVHLVVETGDPVVIHGEAIGTVQGIAGAIDDVVGNTAVVGNDLVVGAIQVIARGHRIVAGGGVDGDLVAHPV